VDTVRPPLRAAFTPELELEVEVEVGLVWAVALVQAAAVISTATTAAPLASPVRTRCLVGIARIVAFASSRLEQSD
jgi:hypothetical protein